MEYLEIFKWVGIAILSYLGSVIIHYFLDKKVKLFRIDNQIIYFLFVRTPLVSTKVSFESEKRIDLEKLKKGIESLFQLDLNDLIKNNAYTFKIKRHPTPFRITLIESKKKTFNLVLETIGDEPFNKIGRKSLFKTISFFEEISKKIEEVSKLKRIGVQLKMDPYLKNNINSTITSGNCIITSSMISVNENCFTKIKPLIQDSLREWKNNLI